jgi:hypothetical protein
MFWTRKKTVDDTGKLSYKSVIQSCIFMSFTTLFTTFTIIEWQYMNISIENHRNRRRYTESRSTNVFAQVGDVRLSLSGMRNCYTTFNENLTKVYSMKIGYKETVSRVFRQVLIFRGVY